MKIRNLLFICAAIFSGTLLFGGVALGQTGVYENDPNPCYDISGTTSPVNVGGVNNSGIIDFDAGADIIDPQYAACVRVDEDGTPNYIQGWAYNDNLGWISFYCDYEDYDGNTEASDFNDYPLGRTNMGIPCGDNTYSTSFTVAGSGGVFSSVEINGYAWGDNIGWMSFGSLFHRLSPDPVSGLIESALPAAKKFSWTDSIGWFDWTGVQFRWLPQLITEDLQACPDTDPNCFICNILDGCVYDPPLADKDSGIEIKITFNPPSGLPSIPDITDAAQVFIIEKGTPCYDVVEEKATAADCNAPSTAVYGVQLDIKWEDSVDFDQTTAASQTKDWSDANYYPSQNPVDKPMKWDDFTASGNEITFNVLSIAPTTDANMSDGFSNERFYYVDKDKEDGLFEDEDYDKTLQIPDYNGNRLILKELSVTFVAFSDDGIKPVQCIYGARRTYDGACLPKNYGQGVRFSYKPLVNVVELYQGVGQARSNKEEEKLDYLDLEIGVPKDVHYQIIGESGLDSAAELKFELGWEEPDADISNKLNLYFTDTGDTGSVSKQGQDFNIASDYDSGVQKWEVWLALQDSEKPMSSDILSLPAYIFSKVTYQEAGKEIKYYANKLPRTPAGLIKNPVAFVKGTVFSTAFATKASNVELRSLGDISENYRKAQINENVAALKTNPNIPQSFNSNIRIEDMDGVITQMYELAENVFYVKGQNITVDCEEPACVPSKAEGEYRVFIVEDGNIKINSDIKPEAGVQVGFIALSESEKNNEANMYIESAVNDILSTHVFLDGMIMSYVDADGYKINDYGWPKFGTDLQRQDLLKNQLRFVGTFATNNGIGNTSKEDPVDHDGLDVKVVTGDYGDDDLQGLARAKSVDLNYLRYFGPTLQMCDDPPNIPRDLNISNDAFECDPNNSFYKIDPTAIAPVGDLILDDTTGTRSEYYKAQGEETEYLYPTYFEYQAISGNLPGFKSQL